MPDIHHQNTAAGGNLARPALLTTYFANIDSDVVRVDAGKLLLSMVHSAVDSSRGKNLAFLIFTDVDVNQLHGLRKNLLGVGKVQLYGLETSSLLDALATCDSDTYFGVLVTKRPSKNYDLSGLADAIVQFDTGLERRHLDAAASDKAQIQAEIERLRRLAPEQIVQERPGKFVNLPSVESVLRGNFKLIKSAAKGEIGSQTRAIRFPDSWGYCSAEFLINSKFENSRRVRYSYAMQTEDLTGHERDYDLPLRIAKNAHSFFRLSCHSSVEAPKTVEILTHFVACTGAIADAFDASYGLGAACRKSLFRSLLHGWLPVCQALEAISSEGGPHLIIDMSAFPKVLYAAVWDQA